MTFYGYGSGLNKEKKSPSGFDIPAIVVKSLTTTPLGVESLQKIEFINTKTRISWILKDSTKSSEAIAHTSAVFDGFRITLSKKVEHDSSGVYLSSKNKHRMSNWNLTELINISTIHEVNHISISHDQQIDINDGGRFVFFGTHIFQIILEFKARVQFSLLNDITTPIDDYLESYQTYFSIYNSIRYAKGDIDDEANALRTAYCETVDERNEFKKIMKSSAFENLKIKARDFDYGKILTKNLTLSIISTIGKDIEQANAYIEKEALGKKINIPMDVINSRSATLLKSFK